MFKKHTINHKTYNKYKMYKKIQKTAREKTLKNHNKQNKQEFSIKYMLSDSCYRIFAEMLTWFTKFDTLLKVAHVLSLHFNEKKIEENKYGND